MTRLGMFLSTAALAAAIQTPASPRLSQAAPPQPAPERNAELGTAIFVLDVGASGAVENPLRVSGQQWTIAPSRYALDQWGFVGGPGSVSATFVYKPKPAVADKPQTLRPEISSNSRNAPLPTNMIVPGYPIGAMGQGAVILQADVASSGKVDRVEVIRPVATLTDGAVQAVMQWTFSRAGVAIVVIDFQRPEYH